LKAASYEGEGSTVQQACEEPFSVRENEARRRIEVSSPVLGELSRTFRDCDDPKVRLLTKVERFHRAATEHLRRSGRPACNVVGTTLLAINRYEFRYSCAASDGAAKGR
jgi:hypothetical protein